MRRRPVLGMKNTQNRVAQCPREKGPLARGRESPTPIGHTGASFLYLGLHLPPSPPGAFPPLFWVISGVIYSSLPFIFLLHLSVIYAYPQVHIPSAILSGAL